MIEKKNSLENVFQGGGGFTLIELLVVIIIVGILAATAIPLMKNVRTRAIISEVVVALGTIRTAERAYYLEYGEYLACQPSGNIALLPGIEPRQGGTYGTATLDGTYFSEECYTVWVGGGGQIFLAWCKFPGDNQAFPGENQAPKKNDASRVVEGGSHGRVVMDENANISTVNIPDSGYQDLL